MARKQDSKKHARGAPHPRSLTINAQGYHYRELNELMRNHASDEKLQEIILKNVLGQRYIGTGLKRDQLTITIEGVPGNDLGMFMDGPTIMVKGNAQDGVGNTMNRGRIVIYGNAGDLLGHSMRGGEIYVKGYAGFRSGLHMKEYEGRFPVIVVGERVGAFAGEYMAGGILVVLGLNQSDEQPLVGNLLGTGIHGGKIFVRGQVDSSLLGEEMGRAEITDADREELNAQVNNFCRYFDYSYEEIINASFEKYIPRTSRPYGRLYAY